MKYRLKNNSFGAFELFPYLSLYTIILLYFFYMHQVIKNISEPPETPYNILKTLNYFFTDILKNLRRSSSPGAPELSFLALFQGGAVMYILKFDHPKL